MERLKKKTYKVARLPTRRLKYTNTLQKRRPNIQFNETFDDNIIWNLKRDFFQGDYEAMVSTDNIV